MPSIRAFLSALLAASLCSGCSGAIGGADYDPAYDFGEFYAATNGRKFQAIVSGNPFPGLGEDEARRRLLPFMQANRPRPRLTFTYEAPTETPHPHYRMVLVFDAANDLTAARVCAGQIRHRPVPSGRFDVFAVYCRNDMALSQTTASLAASGPEDPRVGPLLSQLFLVLFSEFAPLRPRVPFFMR